MRALLLCLLAGCNSILGIPEATPLETLDGQAIDTYWLADSNMQLPRDLSMWEFAALVPNPDAEGGFDVYPGTGNADGTFTIDSVPNDGEPYFLKIVDPRGMFRPKRYVHTTDRTFDLGGNVLGRPNPQMTTQPTLMTLDIANLQAYQETDFLEVFCINNGGAVFDFPHLASTVNPPMMGATALDVTFDWSQPYGAGTLRMPVINGDLNDSVAVIQTATQNLPSGIAVSTMARILNARFNQPDGSPYTISGQFTTLTPTLSLDLALKRSRFEAHRAEINPNTRPQVDGDYIYGDTLLPSPNGYEQYGPTIDLTASFLPAGAQDVASGVFNLANPFPSSWGHIRIMRITFGVAVAVENAQQSYLHVGWAQNRNLNFVTGIPYVDLIEPTVSPVLSPLVNGTNAFTGGSLPIAEPLTLSWTPPTVGSPARYAIDVVRAYNDAGKTRLARELTVFTPETEVTIPTELMASGHHYIFVIYAESAFGVADAEQAPMISGVWDAQ